MKELFSTNSRLFDENELIIKNEFMKNLYSYHYELNSNDEFM